MTIATFEVDARRGPSRRSAPRPTIREVRLMRGGFASPPGADSVGDRVSLGGRAYRVAALEPGAGAGSTPYVHLGPLPAGPRD